MRRCVPRHLLRVPPSLSSPLRPLTTTPEGKESFLSLLPTIVSDLSHDPLTPSLHPLMSGHLTRVLEYNLRGGKMNRGMSVVSSYSLLASPNQITEDNLRLAGLLGWTVEFLQAFFLVADDIMDGSETRRGQPCWFRQPDIGTTAFNDSIFLETCVYSVLRKHFRHLPCYLRLLENLLETTRLTAYGQVLDLSSAQQYSQTRGLPGSLDTFTMARYTGIVRYKTSHYSFCLPVHLAMALAGVPEDQGLYEAAQDILLDMGHFFQAQDDFLDCFGDPSVTGKVGTDIQDGKCSWLMVTALGLASKGQKQVLVENYGSGDEERVARVREVFRELRLEEVFHQYEVESRRQIMDRVDRLEGLPRQVFVSFLDKIYGRTS